MTWVLNFLLFCILNLATYIPILFNVSSASSSRADLLERGMRNNNWPLSRGLTSLLTNKEVGYRVPHLPTPHILLTILWSWSWPPSSSNRMRLAGGSDEYKVVVPLQAPQSGRCTNKDVSGVCDRVAQPLGVRQRTWSSDGSTIQVFYVARGLRHT